MSCKVLLLLFSVCLKVRCICYQFELCTILFFRVYLCVIGSPFNILIGNIAYSKTVV